MTQGAATPSVRVFLSYKRNAEPDESVARDVHAALSATGQTVFMDQTLKVGQPWAEEIETQIKNANYLIVFLTRPSVHSEMVRGEIEIARKHSARYQRPQILPVRVNYDEPLPYPLNAYLGTLQ